MSTFKRAKVVMLPTKEKAEIYECSNFRTPTLVSKHAAITQGEDKYQGVHLYIISNDEIKDGDYMLHPKEGFAVEDVWHSYPKPIKSERVFYATVPGDKSGFKKVIATTDKSLNLAQPSESFVQKFIEAYNKGEVIIDAMVEYEEEQIYIPPRGCSEGDYYTGNGKFKLKVNSKDNTITIRKQKDSWNREEVKELLSDLCYRLSICGGDMSYKKEATEKFIEENL